MAVIVILKIMNNNKLHQLVTRLRADFPQFVFQVGDQFKFQPIEQTITYQPQAEQAELLLLHELAHALLQHANYRFDIELVKMEADAWEYTKNKLLPSYDIATDPELIDDTLESYREWLYQRSCCPQCGSVGSQAADLSYKCLECPTKWQPNDAKFTALRRKQLN